MKNLFKIFCILIALMWAFQLANYLITGEVTRSAIVNAMIQAMLCWVILPYNKK
jgi:hypothetical protein